MCLTLFEGTLPRAAAKLVLTRTLSAKHVRMHLSMAGRIEPIRNHPLSAPLQKFLGTKFSKEYYGMSMLLIFLAPGCRDRNPGFPLDTSHHVFKHFHIPANPKAEPSVQEFLGLGTTGFSGMACTHRNRQLPSPNRHLEEVEPP